MSTSTIQAENETSPTNSRGNNQADGSAPTDEVSGHTNCKDKTSSNPRSPVDPVGRPDSDTDDEQLSSPTPPKTQDSAIPTRILTRNRLNPPTENPGSSTTSTTEKQNTTNKRRISGHKKYEIPGKIRQERSSSLTPPPSDIPFENHTEDDSSHHTDEDQSPPKVTGPTGLSSAQKNSETTPAPISRETFTIIAPESLRKKLHDLARNFQKGRVTKEKWVKGWTALEYLLKLRLNTPDVSKIPTATFIYNNALFTYETWIKEISDTGEFFIHSNQIDPAEF
jgi:hypothetical protein